MTITVYENGKWLAQVSRYGKRLTRRGSGGEKEAKRTEAQLLELLEHERCTKDAERIDRDGESIENPDSDAESPMVFTPRTTLFDYYNHRWLIHSRAVHAEASQNRQKTFFKYLLHYLGAKTLEQCLKPETSSYFVERMKTIGGLRFWSHRRGLEPRRTGKPLSDVSIGASLNMFSAILYLAWREGTLPRPPRIERPRGKTTRKPNPINDDDLRCLIRTSKELRPVAPLLPEFIRFAVDTGIRGKEILTLRWRDVDLEKKLIRVVKQNRKKMIEGRSWLGRNERVREIPMTERVEKLLQKIAGMTFAGRCLPDDVIKYGSSNELFAIEKLNAPDALVFPNDGGPPYIDLGEVSRAGSRCFDMAVRETGLSGKVSFMSLRDAFVARLLEKDIPHGLIAQFLGCRKIEQFKGMYREMIG